MSNISIFKRACEESLKNAELWIEEGNILFKSESYGHSSVLYIHGIEGLIHAYYIWLVYIGAITVSNKDFLDVFKDHKPKFKSFYGFILGRMLFKTVQNAPDRKKKANEIEKAIETDLKILKHESANFAKTLLNARNNGIYTQYYDNPLKFHQPYEITKKEAESIRTLVYSTYEVVSSFIRNPDETITENIIKVNRELYSPKV